MGCDIHVIAEVKVNDKWIVNPYPVFKNTGYNPDRFAKSKHQLDQRLLKEEINQQQYDSTLERYQKWYAIEHIPHPSTDRWYDWFSVLADVRNGYGFAGIRTGQGFAVIAEPRGVPEDATKDWREYVEGWGNDIHSLSYLTLEDFDNFDWNQTTMKRGVISLEKYRELRENNEAPDMYSGGISGGNIITISTEAADKVIDETITELCRPATYSLFDSSKVLTEEKTLPVTEWDIHVEYFWPVIYREWFKNHLESWVEPLRELEQHCDQARVVFGFDN